MLLSSGFCQNSVEAWRVLGLFVTIVKIVVPLIIIITSVVPIFNAIISGSAQDTKKSWITIGKKLAAGVIVFFIPSVVTAAINFFTSAREGSDIYICTICFDSPVNSECGTFVKKFKDMQEAEKEKFEQESINGSLNTGDLEDGSESFTGRGANSVSDKTSYGNLTLDVEKAIDTNVNNPSSGLGDGRNKYRAVQAAAYTGKYAVYAQNKNYGSIESSSKGGRICWSDMQTGEQVKCVEVGSEGGHMDGLAYDSDRGCVLKTVSGGRLLVMDNNKMEIVGYSKIAQTHVGITYVPSIHMLVGYSNGGLVFYKYNQNNNTYEKDHFVKLENYDGEATQGIGTDGTNIFIADSSPYHSKRNLYTYSLDGKRLEMHSFGSGFGSMSSEVEAAFADNNGVLYLACPQGIARVKNYTANKIGLL